MDITATTAPKSDQANFDDFISGPRTFTISEVRAGNAEQPVELHLAEFPGRPYKPNKSMRRVLVAAWGPETTVYVGRRLTLYGDPAVKWAGEAVGGIRIAELSHIDKPMNLALTVTRGKRSSYTVRPLTTPAPTNPSGDLLGRAERAVAAFAGLGIALQEIESRMGKPRGEWGEQDIATLLSWYQEAKTAAAQPPPDPAADDDADALWTQGGPA